MEIDVYRTARRMSSLCCIRCEYGGDEQPARARSASHLWSHIKAIRRVLVFWGRRSERSLASNVSASQHRCRAEDRPIIIDTFDLNKSECSVFHRHQLIENGRKINPYRRRRHRLLPSIQFRFYVLQTHREDAQFSIYCFRKNKRTILCK